VIRYLPIVWCWPPAARSSGNIRAILSVDTVVLPSPAAEARSRHPFQCPCPRPCPHPLTLTHRAMFLGTGNMMLERGQQVIDLKGVDGPTLKKVISGTDAPSGPLPEKLPGLTAHFTSRLSV
jgi:hypothetical protein